MSNPIRLLILDAAPSSQQTVATMLGFDPGVEIVGQATNGAEGLLLVESQQPDLVLIADTLGFAHIPKLVWQITSRARTVGVIVMSNQTTPEQLRRAMLAGARGFVSHPAESRELRTVVRDVFARILEERHDREQRMVAPTGPLVVRHTGALGHVVTVFGAKGGVGKTTLAVNLAVSLRQTTNRSVLLFDGDLAFGDAELFLDLAPVHTLLDVLDVFEREPSPDNDTELIKGYLARYEPLGLRVLLSPTRPEHANLVTPQGLRRLLAALPRLFDYIVIDSPITYDECMFAVLDASDQILFVVTPEVGPLKNARHFLDLCELLGYPRERVQVTLNRASTQVTITAEDVHRWLAYPVTFHIQSGGAKVSDAANKGVPLIIQDPRNPASQDIAAMAAAIIRAAEHTRQTKGTDFLRRPPDL